MPEKVVLILKFHSSLLVVHFPVGPWSLRQGAAGWESPLQNKESVLWKNKQGGQTFSQTNQRVRRPKLIKLEMKWERSRPYQWNSRNHWNVPRLCVINQPALRDSAPAAYNITHHCQALHISTVANCVLSLCNMHSLSVPRSACLCPSISLSLMYPILRRPFTPSSPNTCSKSLKWALSNGVIYAICLGPDLPRYLLPLNTNTISDYLPKGPQVNLSQTLEHNNSSGYLQQPNYGISLGVCQGNMV